MPVNQKAPTMAPIYRFATRRTDTERDDANRQTTGLLGLAMVLALVVVSFYLIKHLHAVGAVEDCLLAGHTNCDLLVAAIR